MICSAQTISLDAFKLAGNYPQKSENPISEIKHFAGANFPDAPSSAVPLPPPTPPPQLTLSCYGPEHYKNT